jgi:hypothetical protein
MTAQGEAHSLHALEQIAQEREILLVAEGMPVVWGGELEVGHAC